MMFLRLKKFFRDIFGLPHFEANFKIVNGKVELTVDYNTAFLNYLDRHGYGDILEPDEKVDVYIKTLYAEIEEETDYVG